MHFTSVLYTFCSLFCTHCKEFRNDFKWHSFCFWNLKVYKEPCYGADNSVNGENTTEAYRVEHHWKRVRDYDVSDPKCESAYSNAKSTDSSREYLRAEDVRDRSEAHDEAAEVNDDANG